MVGGKNRAGEYNTILFHSKPSPPKKYSSRPPLSFPIFFKSMTFSDHYIAGISAIFTGWLCVSPRPTRLSVTQYTLDSVAVE